MGVIIGMDPHKRSATIEAIDDRARVLAAGRYGTDRAGYAQMLKAGRKFADRVWAIEGCNGVGRHIAYRLVASGETVLDVPARLSAQVRVFATGNGRKTDPVDAHSVALAALRSPKLVESRSTRTWWCWACSQTGVTNSAGPGPRPSAGSTGCCSSSSRAAPGSSCPGAGPRAAGHHTAA
jgi:Transposase